MVHVGRMPTDFKPMPEVGAGAYEIRVRDEAGAFRVIYVAKFDDAVYVPHAFQKKTRATAKADIDLAARRYKLISEELKRSRVRITRGSGNVFLDLGFPPHEAAVMLLRCELAEALRKWISREELTQAQAAKRLGGGQSRISEIACNKVDKLSLNYLVGLCAKAGLTVAVKWAA
jgi:predicted XRE-type DNA-binding protein